MSRRLRKFLGAVCIGVCLACGGGGGGADTGQGFTQTDAETTERVSEGITTDIQANFNTAQPVSSLQSAAARALSRPEIESAIVTGKSMIVTYKNGWSEQWIYNAPLSQPVWASGVVPPSVKASGDGLRYPGNKRALLINVVANDAKFAWVGTEVSRLRSYLTSVGYTGKDGGSPDLVSASEADIDAFKKMGGYGFVYLITHGGADGDSGSTWVVTGDGISLLERVKYFGDVRAGRMRASTLLIAKGSGGGQVEVVRNFWSVSEKFIDKEYPSGSFPDTIFWNGACQGYLNGRNTGLAKALVNKGAAAYLGWTENQGISPFSANALFGSMGGGRNLGQAYNSLTQAYRRDSETSAELKYYPSTATEVQLTGKQVPFSVEIFTPTQGQSVDGRVIDVTGRATGASANATAVLSVNGAPFNLQLASDGSFTKRVALRNGQNTLTFTVTTDQGTKHATVVVNATTPADLLWTELIWDSTGTDVDLHLLRPGVDLGSLWTPNDCYFGNKNPSWGASLDVDDVDGFGPEHITMRTSEPGTYTLVVHYYSDHGNGASNAQVFVSANGTVVKSIGPTRLAHSSVRGGDVWSIVRVSYPSGQITVLDELETWASRARMRQPPRKPLKP